MPQLEKLQKQADDLQRQIAAQQKADAALAKAKSEPREPAVVLTDLLELIVMRLGNRPDVKLLIAEFKAATHQSPPPGPAPTA